MKKRLYRLLEPSPPGADRLENAVDAFILTMILLSVATVVLGTVDRVAESYGFYLRGFQLLATGLFTVEYLLRVYSCTVEQGYGHPVWGRLRFIVSPMAVVDLLAVAPFYVMALVAPGTSLEGVALLLRMLRLLKLFRYSRSLTVFARVLTDKANQLLASFFMTALILVFFSSLVYFAERGAQPGAFSSIPETMWWGIITLTTVGYGDVSPVTPLGQLFGAVTAVVGIGLVALPSGILASGFIEAFAEGEDQGRAPEQPENESDASDEAGRRCPRCGRPL